MHRLADHNEDYAPFQIDWVGVQAKQLQREGSLCGCPEPPGNWRYPLLGLQVSRRLFWASLRTSLRAFWPSMSPTLSHWMWHLTRRTIVSGILTKQKKYRVHISISFSRNKYFGTFLSVWSIANLKVAASYRPLDYGQFSAVWQDASWRICTGNIGNPWQSNIKYIM